MKEIGLEFKKWLNMNHISQQDVADKLGNSLQYVNGICNGHTPIGKKLAKKLADIYGISEAFLLTGIGEIAPTLIREDSVEYIKQETAAQRVADAMDLLAELSALKSELKEVRDELRDTRALLSQFLEIAKK